jgi:hypothetical protein
VWPGLLVAGLLIIDYPTQSLVRSGGRSSRTGPGAGSGAAVFHCHIVDHEDLGMMATGNVKS